MLEKQNWMCFYFNLMFVFSYFPKEWQFSLFEHLAKLVSKSGVTTILESMQ